LSQVQLLLWQAANSWRNLGGADRAGDRVPLTGQALLMGLAWIFVPMGLDPWDWADCRAAAGCGVRRELVRGDVERGLPWNEDKLELRVCLHTGWV
jgi:hypothetical protein